VSVELQIDASDGKMVCDREMYNKFYKKLSS
jgi:hypothetical protein